MNTYKIPLLTIPVKIHMKYFDQTSQVAHNPIGCATRRLIPVFGVN